MKVCIETAASSEDCQAVRDGLTAFNLQHIAPDGYEPLHIFVRDDGGRVRGGLLGETFWQWLHISILWLDESLRGQGLGSRLVRTAEGEAVGRGCRGVFVNTFDFQAPEFYQKLGYVSCGVIEDLPPGQRRIFFQKRLEAGTEKVNLP